MLFRSLALAALLVSCASVPPATTAVQSRPASQVPAPLGGPSAASGAPARPAPPTAAQAPAVAPAPIAALEPPAAAEAAPLAARAKLTGEQELAKKLEGRVAGKPQSCIDHTATQTMEVIDKTAIVFGWGDTIWVNRRGAPREYPGLTPRRVVTDLHEIHNDA